MNNFFRSLVALLLFLPFYLNAQSSDGIVTIYSGASAENCGRSLNRKAVTSVRLDDFIDSESVFISAGGVKTCVLIDARVKNALDTLLEDRDYVIVEDSVLTKESDFDSVFYGFTWEKYGFEIVFSFEKTSDTLLSEIEKIYGQDAWLHGELIRSYDDNYSITINKAEDVLGRADGKISFLEAMISATVIGSTFQPLLGIHDGLGVLDELGLATARIGMLKDEDYVEYRRFESNEDLIKAFIHSVNRMQGDFVDNLYSSINEITQKTPEDNDIMLPEDFFGKRAGDNTDFALFYYDILKRTGYQVKYIVIDAGDEASAIEDSELYSTVFFREKGTDLWGRIDGNELEREKAEKWRRLPALVFTGTVKYFEPDIEKIITDRAIVLPPPSNWYTSLY